MHTTAPDPSDVRLHRQRALLLHQLANAPDGKLSQSDANKTLPKQIKDELQLTPAALKGLRQTMVQAGWLAEEKSGRVITHSVTEVGREQLRQLEPHLPLLPAGGKVNPAPDARVSVERDIYVLSALAQAPQHTISKAELEVGFGGKGQLKVAELVAKHPHLALFRDQHCLGLNPATTRAVLTELALRGDVEVHRGGGSESYALTRSGAERLGRLREQCPVLPPTGKAAPDESLRRSREAYLLLRLLQCAKHTLWGADAHASNKKEPLKLNHATAWQVRGDLARAGHVALNWDGKEGSYTLTSSGQRYLTTLPFDDLGEVKIKGSVLTELLTAARDSAAPAPGAAAAPGAAPKATPTTLTGAQLEAGVMGVFNELLGGPYANLRMVPIHEIRTAIAERFGSVAASHAAFNECVLGLRRAKQLRLISIDDRSRATPEQLRDSVFAVGETFFYAESAHAAV